MCAARHSANCHHFIHSYQPSFISKLQIKFAEFPYLLYFVSNRVYSTREPVADWSTEIEGSIDPVARDQQY